MTDSNPSACRKKSLLAGLFVAVLGAAFAAQAQGLRLGQDASPRVEQRSAAVDADFIVALVNAEPVTNQEVRQALRRIQQQIGQRGGPMPPADQLAREVLEQLISERAMLQHAVETG
ncbi:SurA N-terminal domain-containing protein, partial [Arthrospira platensis SPKY1]|nr:SurA N-terminal domain-containing protein [Arthrospira platensis SPKY1]